MADTATAGDPPVRVERTGAVATVTLNRPASMNSMSVALKEQLLADLIEVGADPTVRAVVLTGAGSAFCVGQDLKARRADRERRSGAAEHGREAFQPDRAGYRPDAETGVAAVNGMAAGAGASLAFACDFRIADTRARFLLAFAGVGLALDSAPRGRCPGSSVPDAWRWPCRSWQSLWTRPRLSRWAW
jgi:2-(1,2-epoxy-1,2-dihydrophenyl)acetyl-CoA isomerase